MESFQYFGKFFSTTSSSILCDCVHVCVYECIMCMRQVTHTHICARGQCEQYMVVIHQRQIVMCAPLIVSHEKKEHKRSIR